MFVLTLLLATVLDIFHPAVPAGGMEKQFVVSTITDSALTGCAMNSQMGSTDVNDPLSIDWMELPESVAENTANWASPVFNTEPDTGGIAPMFFAMPVEPPSPPLPPPVAVVPEPSTYAILGTTAAMLIFLLFSRRYARRLS